ncbi:conserved hypothetical protein, partial [Ricinus communis]
MRRTGRRHRWTPASKNVLRSRRRSAHCVSRSARRHTEVAMKRFAEYQGWTIEASPTRLVKQRLFVSGVVIERDGVRFVFADLGNRVYRQQAYERGIEWAKQWIDNNYGYG